MSTAMLNTITGLAVALVGVSLPAVALSQTPCPLARETITAVTAPVENLEGKEVLARSAYTCGHFWSSANLQEKSVDERGSALERFNLASAYARVGQYEAAIAIYDRLVSDGIYTRARMDEAATEEAGEATGFNIAEEAARRTSALRYLTRLIGGSQTTASATLPLTAEQSAVNVADVVRPTTAADTRVPDATALVLDGL